MANPQGRERDIAIEGVEGFAAMIDRRLIAPCGMNCALCMSYQRPKRKCPGCRGEGPEIPEYCHRCIIRNCDTIWNSASHLCHECERMPCKRLKQLDARYRAKYGMSMIANLEEIKEQGMDAFLSHQESRYRCPICHGLLCVHRSRCLSCDP